MDFLHANGHFGTPVNAERDVENRNWIDATIRRFESPLVLYAVRICGDADRARDVVQDTFVELCEVDRAVVEPKLAQWLFTVCRNKALDARRREKDMTNGFEERIEERESADDDPALVLGAADEHVSVSALVERLPRKQQEVLRLKFQAGLSYKEIAAVTGDSVGNVGFLLHTALHALRERMAVRLNGTRRALS